MVKAQIVRKPLKSNLQGKITKRKTLKPRAEVKNKLKQLAVADLKTEPIKPFVNKSKKAAATEVKNEPMKSHAVVEKPKPKGKFMMRLRNKPPLEDEEKPKRNYVLLTKNVDDEQVQKGVDAFYKYLEKSPKKSELFDEEQPIFLQVQCIKVPQTAIRHIRMHLKHSLVTDSSEICLIVSDKGKRKEQESTVEHYENILNEKGITNIKTIMPFNQFKSEYGSQYELKRKLLNLYDHFLVDARVNCYVHHMLGSIFYESRKMPTAVKLDVNKLNIHFDNALKKTIMKIHAKGDSYAVQIGHTKMSQQHVSENIIQIAEEIDTLFPGGFDNVRLLGIKTNDSISIPIYLTLKNNRTVKVPVCKPKLPKHYGSVKGSLSTYLNASVVVAPTGEVVLKKHKIRKAHKIPVELVSMNEDEVEDAEVVENEIDEPKEEVKVDKSNEEESDEDDEDLAKEEEMYLSNYEHQQEEHEEKKSENEEGVNKKRKNTKGKPAKKVKQK